jgi:hypothetical protein
LIDPSLLMRPPRPEPQLNRTVRTAGLVLAAASLLLTAGCARGGTALEFSPTDGAKVDTAEISLRNVVVVSDEEGGSAIIAAVSNRTNQADVLTGISSGPNPLTRGNVALPPRGAIFFGSDERPGVLVPGNPAMSTYVPLTFSFQRAGDVDVQALVVPVSEEYEGVIEAAREGVQSEPADSAATTSAPTQG